MEEVGLFGLDAFKMYLILQSYQPQLKSLNLQISIRKKNCQEKC